MKKFHPNSPDLIKYIKSLPTCAGIYLISCKDGTTYLGATINLQQRCRDHLSKSGRFYGERFDVIETLEHYDVAELRAIEDRYLNAFNFEHNSLVASPYSYTAATNSRNFTYLSQ